MHTMLTWLKFKSPVVIDLLRFKFEPDGRDRLFEAGLIPELI
jgi:hypothetical protein